MSEDWQLEIDTTELTRALRTVIEHLEQADGSTLRVPHDYYWSVPSDAIYNVLVQPELTIGQLSESWDNLKRERAGVGDDTIGYAAVWLGDILKALGHSHVA